VRPFGTSLNDPVGGLGVTKGWPRLVGVEMGGGIAARLRAYTSPIDKRVPLGHTFRDRNNGGAFPHVR
jgi:hypothetical protein